MSHMRWESLFIAVAIVLMIPATVKAQVLPGAQANLVLDQGFVGHPVSLDLFEGTVTLAWDGQTLVAPSGLTVTLVQGTTSSNDQQPAAPAVSVAFDHPEAISSQGHFLVRLKADRPPSSTEQAEANVVIPGSASTTVIAGTFAKDRVAFTVPASPVLTVSPTYRNGLMRQGMASWYSYKKCLCAASPDVPKGTRLIVRRADDRSRFVVVTVNDWGPERDKFPERAIDLDKVAFKRIGNTRGGVLRVVVDVVPPDDPLWKRGDEIPPPNWKKLFAALQQ